VGDEDLIGIGRFAVLAGLSIVALRHYDEVGLLAPAVVDARSGYRRYRLEQVRDARVIAALRAVDVPIDAIREAIIGGEAAMRSVLVAHRDTLAARHAALTEWMTTLDAYIENGVNMAKPTGSRVCEINLGVNDLDAARAFYEAVFAVEFSEERHGDGPVHLFAAFGVWPSDEFFLLTSARPSGTPTAPGAPISASSLTISKRSTLGPSRPAGPSWARPPTWRACLARRRSPTRAATS